jgi:PAS domain S-box-containing protein
MLDVTTGLALIVMAGAVVALASLYLVLKNRHQRATARLSVSNMQLTEERAALRKAEHSLLRAEEWNRVLSSNTRDLVFVYGITKEGLPGHFIRANQVACEKLEYPLEKLLTMTPLDVEAAEGPAAVPRYSRLHDSESTVEGLSTLADDDILNYESTLVARRFIRSLMEKKQLFYEHVYVTRSGKRFPAEINAQYFELLGQPIVMCIVRDITGRIEAELALRESERRFRGFFAYSPIGVAIYDGEKNLVDVNRACLKMYGAPDIEAFRRFSMFSNPFLPAEVKSKIDRGQTVRYEAVIDFEQARGSGLLITARSGRAYFDILTTNLGTNADFKPKGYLVQVQDITGRRTAEDALRDSERQLRQAQKMEAIGTLAGGIAHDFNNILTPILGYAEMGLDHCEGEGVLHKYMREIVNASLRAKELANQILTFSRRTETEGKPIRITPIVKEVLALQRASLPAEIEVKRVIKTDKDVVAANPTQMHQVLMNLCTNAAYVMRDTGGILEVVMTDFVLGARSTSEFPNLDPGRYLRLSVRDTGCGMDQATADRIFEPFFTTKARGEGTGMGLAVVHGIVTSLKGTITVDSTPGRGSVFHVILPVLEQTPEETRVTGTPPPTGDERVLFVDDEPEITRMEAHMLGSLGYQPVAVTRSTEAYELFRRNPDQFDVVITDQVMPEMTGTELAGEILKIRPDLPIIVCTGFSERLTPEQTQAAGIREVLRKPIVRRDLAECIRRVLDSSSHASPG